MQSSALVHYNSEHMVSAFLTVCLFLVCRIIQSNGVPAMVDVIGLGVALGSAPYAKLQAVPIVFVLSCMTLHCIWIRCSSQQDLYSRVLILALSVTLFSVANLLMAMSYSAEMDFIRNYVTQNLAYVKMANWAGDTGLGSVRRIFRNTKELWGLYFLTAASAVVGGLALADFFLGKTIPSGGNLNQSSRMQGAHNCLYGLVLVVFTIYAILKSGQSFAHYTLLLLVPCGFLIDSVLGWVQDQIEGGAKKGVTFGLMSTVSSVTNCGVVLVSLLLCGRAVVNDHPYLRQISEYRRLYLCRASQRLLELSTPSDRMAVWGWSPEIYVETGLVQATRESNTLWCSVHTPQQAYFVKRFATDLHQSNPKLFVDAQFARRFTEKLFVDSYLSKPEIADLIQDRYLLADEIDGFRIFVRRD